MGSAFFRAKGNSSVIIVKFEKNSQGLFAWHDDGRRIILDRAKQNGIEAGVWTPVNLSERENCWVATPIIISTIANQVTMHAQFESVLRQGARDLAQREADFNQREAALEKREEAYKNAEQAFLRSRQAFARLKNEADSGKLEAERDQLLKLRQELKKCIESLNTAVTNLIDAREEVKAAGGYCNPFLPRVPHLPPSQIKQPEMTIKLLDGKTHGAAANGKHRKLTAV